MLAISVEQALTTLIDLFSFSQWSFSDLVGNAPRGVFAEYIVSIAV